jgi:hypothetical protein
MTEDDVKDSEKAKNRKDLIRQISPGAIGGVITAVLAAIWIFGSRWFFEWISAIRIIYRGYTGNFHLNPVQLSLITIAILALICLAVFLTKFHRIVKIIAFSLCFPIVWILVLFIFTDGKILPDDFVEKTRVLWTTLTYLEPFVMFFAVYLYYSRYYNNKKTEFITLIIFLTATNLVYSFYNLLIFSCAYFGGCP